MLWEKTKIKRSIFYQILHRPYNKIVDIKVSDLKDVLINNPDHWFCSTHLLKPASGFVSAVLYMPQDNHLNLTNSWRIYYIDMMKSKILKHFKKAGIEIDEFRADLLVQYYNLIIANNDDNDLTRIKGEDNFIIKHFVDSVYYTKFFELPSSLVDIGTGAGFPGIPLKIMFPDLTLILAEQRKRRIDFLKLAVNELELKDVDFYPHKVTEKSFFNVDGVITRALEDAPETLSRVEHFLPRGGRVILLKGPDAQGDLDQLTERNKKLYSIETDRNTPLVHLSITATISSIDNNCLFLLIFLNIVPPPFYNIVPS